MRLIPRRDHPFRRALRAWGRRCIAALGPKRLSVRPADLRRWQRCRAVGSGVSILFISGEYDTPGHAYRVDRFAEAAGELGCIVDVLDSDDLAAAHWSDAAPAPHVVIIWRARWRRQLEEAVAAWRRRGARIVFDIDDLMVDPTLADPGIIDGIRSMGLRPADIARHYAELRRTLELTDECRAPTEPLAAALRACGKPAEVAVNGFDQATYTRSRTAVLRRRAAGDDGLIRIGYASGSRTHQRDFAVVADAVAAVLRARPACRLVLFREPRKHTPLLDVQEFPALAGLEDRIEWRPLVPLDYLPDELVRFDVNLAPLEVGNPFCEAKSELKFFEAALVDVATIASPTQPFRGAILPGETGLLATTPSEWEAGLFQLVDDRGLRQRLARKALHHVLHRYGPDGCRAWMQKFIERLASVPAIPHEWFRTHSTGGAGTLPCVPEVELLARHGEPRLAQVAVVVPLHNVAGSVDQTLKSVACQTLDDLELVVVDDRSTDASLDVAWDWLQRHADRFVSVTLLRVRARQGRALTRNAGFAAAEAPFVFPLDVGITLDPDCLRRLCEWLHRSTDTAVLFTVRHVFEALERTPVLPWDPASLPPNTSIEATGLFRKAAWAHVGGYVPGGSVGREDYDLSCRFIEHGFRSEAVPQASPRFRSWPNVRVA